MYVAILDRVHVRLSNFFDQGGGEPDGDLEFRSLEILNNDRGVQSIVQRFDRGSPPQIEAVKEVSEAVGP